ncbi:uncharacterized protein V1478_008257 [Vespula squamosa]|uniref:Uncharacterized protein n=1 Tax=Vespula squamosa TaxID=30214 RepID=A0ABD2AY90_VESSQ
MPKKCTDPRCPLNIYLNAKESQKCAKPCVTFSSDGERKNRIEQKRSKCTKQKPKKSEEKDARCGICCRNKRCKPFIEQSTSADSLKKTRAKKSGMKNKANRYEEDEERNCCRCKLKQCCNPKKKKKPKRSRCKRKKRCGWLRKCFRVIFFCCRSSKKCRSRTSHVTCNSSPEYEYCCAYRDVR